jgi:hypothetical protein
MRVVHPSSSCLQDVWLFLSIRLAGDHTSLLLLVLPVTAATSSRCRDPMTEVRGPPSERRAEGGLPEPEREQGGHKMLSHLGGSPICSALAPNVSPCVDDDHCILHNERRMLTPRQPSPSSPPMAT